MTGEKGGRDRERYSTRDWNTNPMHNGTACRHDANKAVGADQTNLLELFSINY